MHGHTRYLNLGHASIRLIFPDRQFADTACQHLFLDCEDQRDPIGCIRFLQDPAVVQMSHPVCQPNAVHIVRDDRGNGLQRITLRLLDAYTMVLDANPSAVNIRYPAQAPTSLLLDDVLQAALHCLLARLGGFLLHGACVAQNGVAMVIMGLSGAGKSTTAFNLTRYGFTCYADDAVLVIPADEGLCVVPFNREISIRPLTFRLLQQQGVAIEKYRQVGEKFFVKPDTEGWSKARLDFVCLVDVSGESDTAISLLDRNQFLTMLVREKKHFTFLARESVDAYAQVLSLKVPVPFCASVGTDLDNQGQILAAVVAGRQASASVCDHTSRSHQGRHWKTTILRDAWSQPAEARLADMIPLMGDFDLTVLKLVFSFFQTYPMGKLEPVGSPRSLEDASPSFPVDWLRADEWLAGCRTLMKQSRPEVLQKFAYPWIRSAPLIYPFISSLTMSDGDKHRHIDAAWSQYGNTPVRSGGHPEAMPLRLVLDQTAAGQPETLCSTLGVVGAIQHVVVVPIFRPDADALAPTIDFIRQARVKGYHATLSRATPLCAIDADVADWLIENSALEMSVEQEQTAMRTVTPGEMGEARSGWCSTQETIQHFDGTIAWCQYPYPACATCGLHPLGLCNGGWFQGGC